MKFLFVAPRFHTNQYFATKVLKEKGHDVRFFVRYSYPEMEKHDFVQPEIIKQPLSFGYFKKLKNLNPDVAIVRNPNELFSFITLIACRLLRVKNIIIYTQGPLYRKKDWRTKFNKILLTIFNAQWITPVLGDKDKYDKFDKRAHYIPFVTEPILKSFEDKKFFAGDRINIIAVGKLDLPRKNILLLLEAINNLKEQFNLTLTIIGYLGESAGEHYKKISGFIKENNLESIVTVKKNLDFFEVHKEYLKHDLFVLPSSNEPGAYSPLEAMSAGLPIITSNTKGARYYAKGGENGYIFNSDDLEDLIEKIRLTIQDRENIVRMGKKSHSIAMQKYSTEKFYNKLMKIIKNE